MKIISKLSILFFIIAHISESFAQEIQILSQNSKLLERIRVSEISDNVYFTINLNGDIPLATYVTARFQNNQPRQRLANGYWIEWEENFESLNDNGFSPSIDDTLTFEIVGEEITNTYLPVFFTISYLTLEGLKSGYLVIDK